MSVRIHKSIGWGVLTTSQSSIPDMCIGEFLGWKPISGLVPHVLAEYPNHDAESIELLIEDEVTDLECHKDWDICHLIITGRDAMVLVSPCNIRVPRYNDVIDYYENPQKRNSVQFLSERVQTRESGLLVSSDAQGTGIYPHDDLMRHCERPELKSSKDWLKEPQEGNWRPAVPIYAMLYLWALGRISEYQKFRPMIYTHWS